MAYCTTTSTNNASKNKKSSNKFLSNFIDCIRPIPIDKLPILLGIQSADLCL